MSHTNPYALLFQRELEKNPLDPSLRLSYVYKIGGHLDRKRFELALQLALSLWSQTSGFAVSKISEETNLRYLDLTSERIYSIELVWQMLDKAFERNQSHFPRFILSKVHQNEYLFGFSFSHLNFDGLSLYFFLKSLEKSYNLREQYAVENGEKGFSNIDRASAIAFWKEEFRQTKGENPPPFLLQTTQIPKNVSKMNSLFHRIEGKLFEEIENFLNDKKTTLFRLIASVHAGLLSRYYHDERNGSIEFLLKHTVSCRKTQNQIGCFTNIVPLPLRIDLDWSPIECIEHIAARRREIKPFQNFPYLQLIQTVPEFRKRGDVGILLNESPGTICPYIPQLKRLSVKLLKKPNLGGQYEFGFHYGKKDETLEFALDYNQEKISQNFAKDYFNSLNNLLEYFIRFPKRSISNWIFPKSADVYFPNTSISAPFSNNLKKKLSQWVTSSKEQLAIKDEKNALSYREIKDKVETYKFRILNSLEDSQQKQEVIAIFLDRSLEVVVSMLSILLAGHIFLPLDPGMPEKRIALFLEKSNCKYLLTNRETANKFTDFFEKVKEQKILFIDEIDQSSLDRHPITISNPLAYILFTSGSTGNPKGVKVSLKNLLYSLEQIQNAIGFKEKNSFLAATSFTFDISLVETILPLLYGGTTYIVGRDVAQNSLKLQNTISKLQPDFFQATPTTWNMLKEIDWRPDHKMVLLTGGEALNESLAEYLLGCSTHVYNLYGPTETTIWSSYHPVTKNNLVSIGTPFPGTHFYIRSLDGNLCPLGKPGELCIAGLGVSEGYIQEEGSPFIDSDPIIGKRFYCTGDLVNCLDKDRIIYLGRLNDEIKMRGHRISLKEVRDLIQKISQSTQVEVVVMSQPEDHLIAFLSQDCRIFPRELKKSIERELPEYMIPKQFQILKQFPTMINGKVDRKQLVSFVNTSVQELNKSNHDLDTIEFLRDEIYKKFDVYIDSATESIGNYGFHSVGVNKLSHLIQSIFGISVDPYIFFEIDTLEKIANLLTKRSSGSFQQFENIKKSFEASSEIGIFGMSGLFPQSQNIEEFWKRLVSDDEFIRKNNRPFLEPRFKAGFIQDPSKFDASFFNVSPLEAELMDPQQRLLLQLAWHAVEDAGYDPLSLNGKKVGVYVASTSSDYWLLQLKKQSSLKPHSMAGFSNTISANRISYFFNWTGPSLHIDTACSGSLSALARAYNDLRIGKSDYALVAASNLILSSEYHEAIAKSHFLSPSFRCAPLDSSADGYVRGEGVICLFLQSFSGPKRNKPGYAKILSIAENHGGKAHSLSAPSATAQKNLLLEAYETEAANRLSYIELHGTGTKLGDPIEIDAWKQAWELLSKRRKNKDSIYVGSIKSQIGHLEAAAGLASIIKVILCFKNKKILKMKHFESMNPYISLENTPFLVPIKNIEWNSSIEKRVAGISSFGFGGSNLHLVLEEENRLPVDSAKNTNTPQLFCFSAKHRYSLLKKIEEMIFYLKKKREFGCSLETYSYMLNCLRSHFSYRVTFIAQSLEELIGLLEEYRSHSIELKPMPQGEEKFFEIDQNKLSDPFYLVEIKKAYEKGFRIEWEKFYSKPREIPENFPKYPFYERSYWFDGSCFGGFGHHKNRGEDKEKLFQIIQISEKSCEVAISFSHPWLSHHVVNKSYMLPGVASLEIAFQAWQQMNNYEKVNCFSNICWLKPIIFKNKLLRISIFFRDNSFDISFNDIVCIRGEASKISEQQWNIPKIELGNLEHRYEKKEIYKYIENIGIEYGPFFKGIKSLNLFSNGAKSVICIESRQDALLTNLIDSALQSTLSFELSSDFRPLLPFAIGKAYFYEKFFQYDRNCFISICEKISKYRVNIFIFCDAKKEILIELIDVCVRPMNESLVLTNKKIPNPEKNLMRTPNQTL